MGLFWFIETGALRVTEFGLGLMMSALLVWRCLDWATRRVLGPDERTTQGISPRGVYVLALLNLVIIFSTTFGSVVQRFPNWLSDPEPVPMHLLHPPILVFTILMINRLEYRPTMSRFWCGGWTVLAHMAQWGGVLLATR